MKKIISTIIIAIVLLATCYISVYATFGARITAEADKTEVNQGDTVTITLKIGDIVDASAGGVTAAEGILEYDENFFETVGENDVEGNLTYSTADKKWLFFSINGATQESEMGKIKLKVKSDAQGTGSFKITSLKSTDGQAEAGSNDISLDIKIASQAPDPGENNTPTNNTPTNSTPTNNTPSNNTPSNNTLGNNTSRNNAIKNNTVTPGGKDDTTSSTKIPNAGVKATILVLILILAVVSGLTYRHYKKYEKI